jgi:putative FmdB family regulatory protein
MNRSKTEATMPIYEYTCQSCESEFELLVRTNEKAACPDCGSKRLEKKLSVPAAHSTGSRSLDICDSPGGGCGLPQCGGGSCAME